MILALMQTFKKLSPVYLKLHQFGHEFLYSLGAVCQSGAQSSPTPHDGIHLIAIPTRTENKGGLVLVFDAYVLNRSQSTFLLIKGAGTPPFFFFACPVWQ